MYLPAVLISLMALAFTVLSFWWLNARTGKLIVYSVMTFAGFITAEKLVLQIPVVVHNTGAKPRVIRALRLEGVDQAGNMFGMEAQTFHATLRPGDEMVDFVHAYSISGRSVVTMYVRFSPQDVPLLVPDQSTKLVLQAQVDEQDRWVVLKTLDIYLGLLLGVFITMSNNPRHWTPSTVVRGRQHQEKIMAAVRERMHRKE